MRLPRVMWTLFEPVHAVTYFTPEARAAFEAAGLRGFWRGYFAGRAAPLGPIGPAPVVAAFFGFAPPMVARALPHVWDLAPPDRVLAARLEGAVAALRRLDPGPPEHVAEAAELAVRAAGAIEGAGRVLGAANAALPVPSDPWGRLWWACTVLREHRGDGHVAALVTAGLTGCDVLCWRATVDIPRSTLQPGRGWTDEEWATSTARLTERGWLRDDGEPTDAGRDEFARIESVTDRLAAGPWQALGEQGTARLRVLLGPLALACFAALPVDTPLGLPSPAVDAVPEHADLDGP